MADPQLKAKVEELIRDNRVLLFMKGTPEMPQCGFSMRVVGVLEQLGVEYGAVDVLPILQPLREVTAVAAKRSSRRARPRPREPGTRSRSRRRRRRSGC